MRAVLGIALLASFPGLAAAQVLTTGAPPPISVSTFEVANTRIWTVFGTVTSATGQPIHGAAVKVSASGGLGPPRILTTDLKGKFSTEYELDSKFYSRINVDVVASLTGFRQARDSAEFLAKEGTREFRLVLRNDEAAADQLSVDALIQSLGPRLRAAGGQVPPPALKHYQKGLEHLLAEPRDSRRAVEALRRDLDLQPSCVPCRVACGLAQLDLGNWANARNRLLEAAGLGESKTAGPETADALLVLGTIEAWGQQPKAALGLYARALERRPEDPLALQEIGRALLAEQNWEAADSYLERAIGAGASGEARGMRVRALLELGEPAEAEVEMTALLAGRAPKEMPVSIRMIHARLQERLQLQAYSTVKSVVAQDLAELVTVMPELAGLEPASDQSSLPELLQRVGQGVEGFVRSLPNTSSREEIREEILDRKGKVRDTIEEKYLYLMLIRPEELPGGTRELRTRDEFLNAKDAALKKGFMITSGFTGTPLNFHTSHQPGAHYRLLGRQVVDGRPTVVVAFAQRPETAKRVGRFVVDGKSVPVLIQGVAWFDSERYNILRMRTDLLVSPPNSRLKRQTTEIQFGEVTFKELPATLWLPREVTVTVEWKGRMYRNFHRYSDFRLFNVVTEERRRA